MNNHPWTAWYWDDWDADTAHLSLTEKGAYLELLKHYYRTQRPLPANAVQLHRICSANGPQEFAAVDAIVREFFCPDSDNPEILRNRRADKELAKSLELSSKRKKAAESRYCNSTSFAPAIAEQLHTHPHPHTHINPKDQNLNNDSASAVSKRGSRIPANFSISPEMRSWALANKLPNPDDHICEFVDYWSAKAGIAGYKLDWQATFRNWLRRVPQYGNGNGNGKPKYETVAERNKRAYEEYKRRQQSAGGSSESDGDVIRKDRAAGGI